MTTGKPRAGQGEIYAGAWGKTRTRRILYSCPCGLAFTAEVHVVVNATHDPALAGRLRQGQLNALRCPSCKTESRAELPVAYHDEEHRVFLLVLPSAFRWRELEERAQLLLALAEDQAVTVPAYVRDFRVVFGGPGIPVVPDTRDSNDATPVSVSPPVVDDGATGPFDRPFDLEANPEQAPTPSPLDARRTHPDARDHGLERWMMTRAPTLHLVEQGRARLCATMPSARIEPFLAGTLSPRIQLHRTPNYPLIVLVVVKDGAEGLEPITFHLDPQRVDDRTVLGALGHAFQFTLDLYDSDYLAVMKRQIEAPLAENVRAIVTGAEVHLAGLPGAQRSFEAALALWHSPTFDRLGRRDHNLAEDSFMLLPTPGTARLALGIIGYWAEPENEDYLLFIKAFPLPWWRRIRSRVLARCVEFGLALPPALGQLAITEGLARSRKDLAHKLVHSFADQFAGAVTNDLDADATRDNWRALVAECEALGVPLEGSAGDLAAEAVGAVAGPPPEAPRPRPPRQARAASSPATAPLGGNPPPVPARKPTAPDAVRRTTVSSDGASSTPVVGGTLEVASPRPATGRDRIADRDRRTPTPVIAGEISARGIPGHKDLAKASSEELIACLDDKDLRRDAAIDLCRRGDAISVGPVFGALRRMTRGEAVRVLPGVVRFGERAVPHLVDGLRSRKGFLRQGCALALGVLKSADGIESLADLLLSEPTDVWREVARAIGEIGSGAVMTLAARIKETNGTNGAREGDVSFEQKRERISWALAHVAARGGRIPVETLAEGRDTVAAQVARRALELTGTARSNDQEVRGGPPPRDQTVNRAFSRRFFEALAGRAPRPLAVELPLESDEELSLDDAEILMDEGEEEVLDDEDLIPG